MKSANGSSAADKGAATQSAKAAGKIRTYLEKQGRFGRQYAGNACMRRTQRVMRGSKAEPARAAMFLWRPTRRANVRLTCTCISWATAPAAQVAGCGCADGIGLWPQ